MYFLLGASIKLAFLLLTTMCIAVVSAILWRLISSRVEMLSPHTRAQLIFALRVGPVFLALVFVFGFVVPAYLLHEPEDSGEVVTLKLALFAIPASIAVLITAIRLVRTWLATRRLESSWISGATEISVKGAEVPVFQMEHPYPVIAVVGIVRPRIFIAREALESLSSSELQAAIAHEHGHIKYHDNLKRSILRAARDMLLVPIGRKMDNQWAVNAECAADEHAGGRSRSIALDLASAIVKLARLAPSATAASAAYLLGQQESEVNDRVRRLLKMADGSLPFTGRRFRLVAPLWVWPLGLAALCFLHIADQSILLNTHDAIERFVSITQ